MFQSSRFAVQVSPRRAGQPLRPRPLTQCFRTAVVVTFGAASVLFSPFAMRAALATVDPTSFPVATTYDSTFVTQLLSAQLTAAGFQTVVGDLIGATYTIQSPATGGANTYSPSELLALPTSDPLFYSTTTPRYYKFKFCNSDPTSYFTVGNVLVQSGDLRPEAKDHWNGTDAVQPTPNVTFDLCSQPKVPFTYPSGFVASGANGNYIFVRRSSFLKIAETIPVNPQRPTFSTSSFIIVLTRTNPTSPVTLPYTQQGTAVYGTDYSTDTTNGVILTANSATLPALATSSAVGFGASAPVYANTNNHPQTTLQWAFTAPPGYTFLGSPVWYARINALNNSTVTVSPINGQSTITPGSTSGGFLLTRTNGDQTVDLPVSYTIGGTATNGTDYGYLSGDATIPAGQSTLKVPIITSLPSGATAIPQKDVLITLTAPSDSSYNVPASGVAGQANTFVIPAYNPSTVSFTQGSGGGTLTPGQSQPFTVTRAGGDLTQPLTVNYTTGGSAQPGVDYQAVSGTVTIPAGATTASVPLSALQHTGTTAFPATTLSLTPAAGNGYDATGAQPLNYTIPAYTPSSVSVTQPGNGGAIPAGGSLPFTVTRTGDTSQALSIPYTVGGTAVVGTDYNQLPGTITIPAGATSATQNVSTPVQTGTTDKPSRTITLTPQAGSAYTLDASNSTATYTTVAYTPSAFNTVTVSLPSGQNTVLVPGTSTNGFTVTRTGNTTAPLTVSYTVGGTGTVGTDYTPLSGKLTLPAGANTFTQAISVPSGATLGKTVTISVAPGSGYSQGTNTSVTYTIGSTAPVTIGNGAMRPPVVSLSFDPTVPAFVVTRTGGNTDQALTIPIDFGGSGVPGVDYAQLPTSVTFGVGKTTVQVPVKLLSTAKTGDTLTASIPDGAGYTVGSGNGTTFTVPSGYNDGTNVSTTTKPASTGKHGGGVTGLLAGAAGLGSIALGSGGLVTGGTAAVASTVVPNLLVGSTLGTIPQSCSTTGETPLQLAQLLPQLKEANPNWSTTTFASVPAPTQAGAFKLGKSDLSWQAGQPVADIVRVGDTDGTFNLHCLGLSKLASVSQLGLAAKPLSTLNLVADTTLQGLSQSLYRRAKTVGDVKGLAEWIASKSAGRFTAEQLSSLKLADLLKAEPALASLPMGGLPLNQLPGYSDLLLGDIPGLASKSISQVAGLSKVPFSQFPVQPKPLTASAQ